MLRHSRLTLACSAAVLLSLLGVSAATASDASDLDPTFNGTGKWIKDFGGSGEFADHANAVAIQPDGKILIAGSANTESDMTVARLNADGTPDTSFGQLHDGKSYVSLGGIDVANDMAIQSDGKIVIGGCSYFGADDSMFVVVRLNPDGTLDTAGFNSPAATGHGTPGRWTADYPGNNCVQGLTMQGNRIVAVGTSVLNGTNAFEIDRLTSAGYLDEDVPAAGHEGFDDDGHVAYPVVGYNDIAEDVVVQGDRLIVAGISFDSAGSENMSAIRVTDLGYLDNTYGPNASGRWSYDSGGFDAVSAAASQADGKTILVGVGPTGFNAIRLTAAGTMDATFSGDGLATLAADGLIGAGDVAVAPDGKIIVVGDASSGNVGVARFNSNGTPDTTFSGNGAAAVDLGGTDFASAVAIQSGKIIVAGTSSDNWFAARLLGTGVPSDGSSGSDPAAPAFCAGKAATVNLAKGQSPTAGNDVIVGTAGNDVIKAGGGNDLVCGGAGDDTLVGGPGKDKLLGEAGNDKLKGGGGIDKCVGSLGKDKAAKCEKVKSVP